MKRVTDRQKGMPRLNAVVNHEVYQTYYKRICECETDRVFCCHQMNHLLDVARIAYIKNLEEGLGFDKELIYVAAVLHDIGKSFQYRQQIPLIVRNSSLFAISSPKRTANLSDISFVAATVYVTVSMLSGGIFLQ